jgi:hypothetical protein
MLKWVKFVIKDWVKTSSKNLHTKVENCKRQLEEIQDKLDNKEVNPNSLQHE